MFYSQCSSSMLWVKQCLKKSKPDKFSPVGSILVTFRCCCGVSAFTELGEWHSTSPFLPVAPLTETAHLQSKDHRICLAECRCVGGQSTRPCTAALSPLVCSGNRLQRKHSEWTEYAGICFFPILFTFFLVIWWGPCNQREWNPYPSRFCLENQISSWVYRITSEFLACHLLEVQRCLGPDMSREGTSEHHWHLNDQVPKNGQIHEQQQGTNWYLQHRST